MPGFSAKATDSAVEFEVIVQPKASKTAFAGLHDGRLKVRIAAPPVDGKANEALMTFLAKTFGVSKSKVILVSGDGGRRKRIRIETDAVEAAVTTLERLTG